MDDSAERPLAGDSSQMDSDEIEVLLSAIEHYAYCPRQCGLIHVEATYRENVYTVRGNLAHERVHAGEATSQGDVRSRRDIPLWSHSLGLRGKADLVEFHPEGPYPVEYKVGKRKSIPAQMQLCAQALCLEEMLGKPVPTGAIYYHGLRRRREVQIDRELRARTVSAIEDVRSMLQAQHLPAPLNDSRCRRCSLNLVCLPQVVGDPHRLRGLQGALYTPYDPREAEDDLSSPEE